MKYTEFVHLKHYYNALISAMPENYEETVKEFSMHIEKTKQSEILNMKSSEKANKLILDCLIQKMIYRVDVLVLCDLLEGIKVSPELIGKLKSGE